MTNWQAVYSWLAKAGYSDNEIGSLANCSRAVICKVRNGTYRFAHDPGYDNGIRLMSLLDQVRKRGILDIDPTEPHDQPVATDDRL